MLESNIGMLHWDSAWDSILDKILSSKRSGKHNVLELPVSFDTEASSFISEQGDEIGLLYIWMFGIDDLVVYGRDVYEFADFLEKLNVLLKAYNVTMYVYVHFLKYDFSFIKKVISWSDVFLHKNREPLYARYENIEFRDSLVLSGGQSLALIGKRLRRKMLKAVGDLDYDKIRSPQTPLTKKELYYCEMDIRVLNEYIREKIEDDGGILKIPYTNTGYVRNYVRDKCFANRGRYMDFIDGLTLTPDAYLQCEQAFMGGAVGPNIKYAGKTLNNVKSYDIKSSYPYVMVTGYYPMSMPQAIPNEIANKNLDAYLDKYCCLFTVEFWGLFPKNDYCFPISYHKCIECIGEREASGRVISAMYVKLSVTELDFDTIRRFYDWDDIRISRMRVFHRGYLPMPIIRSVLKFFNDKTTLDGVNGKEREYMISKNMLNAIYGMMVEKIVRELFLYSRSKDFYKDKKDYIKQVVEYNEKRNRFLYYPWGVWVTAHARHRLFEAIEAVGDDFVYCDTDSVKFMGNHHEWFELQNCNVRTRMKEVADRCRLDLGYVIPSAPSGDRKCLGVWEHEYDCYRFKTLGAKRYLAEYSWKSGNNISPETKYEVTVAGCNKSGCLEYLLLKAKQDKVSPFSIFSNHLVVPKEYARRNVAQFIDSEKTGYATDYLGNRFWFDSPSGVYLASAEYSFSITESMLSAILWLTHDGHYTEDQM